MEITVTGRKIKVGEALSTHIKDRLIAISEKYFNRTIDSGATVTKEGHLYRIDISMHANQGVNLQSRGEAEDPYASFEDAAVKVEKQLRRYKRRLKNHHANAKAEVESIPYTVIAPEGEEASESDAPIIIAETHKDVPTIAVGDAVMLMDLAHTNAFLFRNSKTKGLEVVYKREDGNIGWISPD